MPIISGDIAYLGSIKPPGRINQFLSSIGVVASFSVSGTFGLDEALLRTNVGRKLYGYGRGSTDYVEECLNKGLEEC